MIAAVPQLEAVRREAWLAERRKHITSSDLAALMGLPDAYGSPMGVYLEKKDMLERGEAPTHLEAGLRLQPVILEWYADRLQVAIEHADPYALVVSPDHPVLAASLDALRVGDRRPVDAKNVRFKRPEEWGPDGSDEIPARYVVQLHAQMICTGVRTEADLATLFAGADPGWFRVPYDQEIGAAIVEAGETFWREHVLADVPPPVDGSDEWSRFLSSRRQKTKDLIPASPEHEALAVKLRGTRQQIDELEEARAILENHLKAAIGEHAGMLGSFGKLSFTQAKERTVVDLEHGIEGFLCRLEENPMNGGFSLNRAAVRALWDDVRRDFTTTKPGSRSFRPYWKE